MDTAVSGIALPAARGPVEAFPDRYRPVRCLKQANGVDTWLVTEVGSGAPAVLKSIDPAQVHQAARLRFEHETEVLRQLSGTGLPGLRDAGRTRDRLFLVQPFLAGRTLEQVLADGPLPPLQALAVAADLAEALELAHSAGICHRDVKPANVMVAPPEQGGTVTLIDFGFARSAALDDSIRAELVGTIRYLAPEAAGLLASPVDERSDLYALGILLFECLAGRPPFLGPSVGELLRQHLSAPVPELRGLGVDVPRAVEEVLGRLLRKEPADRYSSAAAVAADLRALSAALAAGEREPRLVIGLRDQRRSVTDPAFVGREPELESLHELVRDLVAGRGGLVTLDAESGGGKSRLLQQLEQVAVREGLQVLRGQGVAGAAAHPFTVLHGVAEGLAPLLQADQDLTARVAAALGGAAATVARALPSLALPLRTDPSQDCGPDQFGEQRSLDGLLTLLRTCASPARPLLVVLDDCQWADRLTLRLLAALAAGPGHELPPGLGVVVAFRTEEVGDDSPLRQLPGARSLHLGPLPATALRSLAESMAGPLPEPALDTVVRLADGSPFMAAAVLRGLVESGGLLPSATGWTVEPAALADVQAARRSAALLVGRLELLGSDALALLSVAAVLGKHFDIATAVELAGAPPGAAAALEQARVRRLLWVDERTGACSFAHDKIREALLERLDDVELRRLHETAARVLLTRVTGTSPEPAAFDLAYHLDAAGLPEQALPFALDAAEQASARNALDSALTHYRIAERAGSTDPQVQRRVAEGLGDVLTLQGRYDQAEEQLGRARALARGPLQAAALEGRLGDVAFKRGDVPTARRHVEGALALLGRPVPRRTGRLLLGLAAALLVQVVHSLLPRTTGRRGLVAPQAEALAMRLYSRLAYINWFGSGRIPCAWAHLRGLNLAERYPPSAELGQAWSEHAPVMTMLPWYARGERYARRSLAVRTALGDVWGQGQSLGFLGVVLYACGRYEQALQACQEAVRLLDSTGDRWESNTATWHIALCQYRLGRLPEAAATAARLHEQARAIGDAASAGIALSVVARAQPALVCDEALAAELARGSEDAHTTSELLLAAALLARSRGELAAAAGHLRAAVASTRRRGLRQEYVAPVPAWLLTVLREQAQRWPAHDPRGRARALRQTARALRRARSWALTYRNNGPHVLREAGLLASLQGRHRRSVRLLQRSVALARRQDAVLEEALSRRALAETRDARERASTAAAQAELARARAAVTALTVPTAEAELPEPAPFSAFDRFTTLLQVGREIAATTSLAGLEQAVRQAGLSLLRGEASHLVRVCSLGEQVLTTESGAPVDAISRTLVAEALRTRTPVVAGEQVGDDSQSLVLAGVRSVLAAPVCVDGEPVSCFYVTHRHVGQLFGPQEVQLAAFISTLAGAALEHLAGSEARFRSLAQSSSDVLTLIDAEAIVLYQSSAVTRAFGLPARSLIGAAFADWVHPDDRPVFAQALDGCLTTGETRVTFRVLHADGSPRHVETTLRDLRAEPSVKAVVLNTRDVTEQRRLEDELREQALHDALTGLPNRTLFVERAQQAMERSRRRHTWSCVAFLDLDDFKTVNDTLGHAAGDQLLQTVSQRLVACVRPADTVARLGGDEFALLLEDTDLQAAIAVIDRILLTVASPVVVSGTEVVVHASVGLTRTDDPTATPDVLLSQADAAMYAAKARGKDRYDLFAPTMHTAMQARSRVRSELDRALASGELVLHYQPLVDLVDARPVGVEALARWSHPQRGLLPPSAFVEAAEETGQILGIGAWALRTACCDAQQSLPSQLRVSVNVSARQLQRPGLVRSVLTALEVSQLAADRLVLEITETAALTGSAAEVDSTIARLAELRALGVQIALDDFGTGFSPLSHLRRFPVDLLKVDRSFVTSLAHNSKDRAIVQGVVELAHALGIRVLAEGVENDTQRQIVTELGCDLGQGFLWRRPAALADLRPRLAVTSRAT